MTLAEVEALLLFARVAANQVSATGDWQADLIGRLVACIEAFRDGGVTA